MMHHRYSLWITLAAFMAAALTAQASPRIGVFGPRGFGVDDRFIALGYATTSWTSVSQISPAALNGVDVLYVTNEQADDLSVHAETIAEWTQLGNGLIVEQPNVDGPVLMMPPGLEASVFSYRYDDERIGAPAVTIVDASHPIVAGLLEDELSSNADKVRRSDLSPNFQILAVQASNPDLVALAAATYGDGRVVFHTGNLHTDAYQPGSNRYAHQMLTWAAAVPEPRSLVSLSMASALMLAYQARRRAN